MPRITMATWQCISNCGACCNLQPEDRPELDQYLTPEQLQQYLSMVGEDGWCVNFEADSRRCKIYRDRPQFCRVQPDTFQAMYGIQADELNDFAIDCCHEQIESIYGEESDEMEQFGNAIGFEHGVEIMFELTDEMNPETESAKLKGDRSKDELG